MNVDAPEYGITQSSQPLVEFIDTKVLIHSVMPLGDSEGQTPWILFTVGNHLRLNILMLAMERF
jgi:hypothetical protein